MTLPVDATAALAQAHLETQSETQSPADAARNQQAKEAARQFEALLLQQLMQVLRKTAPQGTMMGDGGGMGGEMYLSMFDEAVAEQLSHGQGIGVGATLERALGGDPNAGAADGTRHELRPLAIQAGPIGPPTGDPVDGATGRLQRAAHEMLDGGAARRWGKEGTLTPQDLSSDFSTQEAGGTARFNVRDANGYRGYYKCNLFAFELARRAGYSVPVVGRHRGWGFPVPNTVTADASDGGVEGRWARVRTGEGAQALDSAIQGGSRAFMLTGAATADRAGHMAVVERVHEVEYGRDGDVRRVVFDGWEARQDGARHLVQRTWNRAGNPGGNDPRNGFQNIEILELVPTSGTDRQEVPISRRAGASTLDGR